MYGRGTVLVALSVVVVWTVSLLGIGHACEDACSTAAPACCLCPCHHAAAEAARPLVGGSDGRAEPRPAFDWAAPALLLAADIFRPPTA